MSGLQNVVVEKIKFEFAGSLTRQKDFFPRLNGGGSRSAAEGAKALYRLRGNSMHSVVRTGIL